MKPLTFAQAVRNAIDAERSASRFYRLLAESTHDREAGIILDDLADQEDAHATLIAQTCIPLLNEPLPHTADHDVSDVETSPDWRFVDDITLPDAIRLALENERHAALFYETVASLFPGPGGDFFLSLADSEEQHVRAMEILRNELLGPLSVD